MGTADADLLQPAGLEVSHGDAGEERRKGMHDREQLRGPPAEQLYGEMRRAGSSAIAGTTEYYVHIALLFSMARLFELAPIFR